MRYDELIVQVSNRTSGTKGDPLTQEEVGTVVEATLAVLRDNRDSVEHLLENRHA